jgi:YD repeat-containing protein
MNRSNLRYSNKRRSRFLFLKQGRATHYTCDASGVRIFEQTGQNLLLDEWGQPQYGVDANGNPLGHSYWGVQLGAVTQTYSYDSAGRLVGQRVLQADASHSHDLHDQGTAQSRGMRSDNPDKPGQVRRPRSTPA